MNDTMSLVLATIVLATSGLGLYMFKSSVEDQKGGEDYDEDGLFGSRTFWGGGEEENVEDDDVSDVESVDDYRKRSRKTKTTRKPNRGTKKNRY